MKPSQLCIGSAALILVYANQVIAITPPDLGDWTMTSTIPTSNTCQTDNSCLTGGGFIQRMEPATSSGLSYFQTIITEQSSPPPPALSCPESFTCGDLITGPGFTQLEFTDGANSWFNTIKSATPMILDTQVSAAIRNPLQLLHTQTGVTLKPGQHLITAYGDTLADQTSNLQLHRTKLLTDPAYLDINQQSDEQQKIYHSVVDAEIAGITNGGVTKLSAQLNTMLDIPSRYRLNLRVMTTNGWRDFISDEQNQLVAAVKLDTGYCPDIESPLYKIVFTAGSECIRITAQDGGPNDGDGVANGSVALTLGVVLKEDVSIAAPDSKPMPTTQNSVDGGGGALPWWLSLALLFRLNRVRSGKINTR